MAERLLSFRPWNGIPPHGISWGMGVNTMNECKGCARCTERRAAVRQGRSSAVRQTVRTSQEDFLWFEDRITDDPTPQQDPQSGDVTDGSVDYYDFEWGEAVFYDESTMEPALFPCSNSCSDPCSGGSSQDPCDPCPEENPCTEDDTCLQNRPVQQDTALYPILPE